MDFSYSAKTKDYLARLDAFMREHIEPPRGWQSLKISERAGALEPVFAGRR
jgi:hypothetical protein|tara:strand:+ start:1881 stop:2033 length:153 start_codon:yes stop_codon:yes gene_type:complete